MLFDMPVSDPPAFIGIANLARQGDILERKKVVTYTELPSRSLLTRCSSARMPFAYTVNPYRGCEFGCKYCYARYTHEFMELRGKDDFERRIFAKSFDAAQFRAELRRVPAGQHIAIGTATDPYQPAERRFCVTRKLLEVMLAERGLRVSITTKSDLAARDAELLAALSRRHMVFVHFTVTTADEHLARLLEPSAPRPGLRLRALSALRRSGVRAGVFASPLIPAINDGHSQLRALAEEARAAGALYFGGAPLFLKPCAAKIFLPFLREEFPSLAAAYEEQYGNESYLPHAQKEELRRRIQSIREETGLAPSPQEYQPEEWSHEPWQPGLFDGPEDVPGAHRHTEAVTAAPFPDAA